MGEGVARSADWWTYRVAGLDRPYGHVVRHREDGPEGAVWDAVVIAVQSGDETAIDETAIDETAIAARVPLDEARAAIERHAAEHSHPA